MSKKYFHHTLLLSGGLMLLSVAIFWWGSGKFFTEDYYPAAVLSSPALFIICAIVLIKDALAYYQKKPYVMLSKEGIQLYGGVYRDIGLVNWREVTGFTETAVADSKKGRYLHLYVRHPEHFLSRIQNKGRRKAFLKRLDNHAGALIMLETSRMDCDLKDLKATIQALIDPITTTQDYKY